MVGVSWFGCCQGAVCLVIGGVFGVFWSTGAVIDKFCVILL